MSRTKKSRKPGASHFTVASEDFRKNAEPAPKKPKKKKGKRPGNRQQEAVKKQESGKQAHINKDPRIGSTKPIALGKVTEPKVQTKPKAKTPAVAPIRYAEPQEQTSNESLTAEMYAIEENEQVQAIIAKQEDEIALTEAEIDFFNEQMARHQEISALLGIDDDDDEEIIEQSEQSEDELWDKLDNNNLSSFE